MESKHQDFKNRKKEITELFMLYKHCKLNISMKRDKIINSKYFNNLKSSTIIEVIDSLMNILEDEEKVILSKSFLLNLKNNWWREYYAKSTFYRAQRRTYNKFMYYLNGKDEHSADDKK